MTLAHVRWALLGSIVVAAVACRPREPRRAPTLHAEHAVPPAAPPPPLAALEAAAPLPDPARDGRPTRAERAAAARSINVFGAGAWAALGARSGNVAFSPASAALALGMASAGARGDTLAAMRAALAHTLEPARQQLALGALQRRWSGPQRAGLRVASANAIFGRNTAPFAPAFVAWTRSVYDAPLEALDFGDAGAAAAHVNAWIDAHTMHRIHDVVGPEAFSGRAAVVLANALYFHGRWATPFDAGATRREAFYVDGTERVRVPTMALEDTFGYARRRACDVLALPFAGGSFAMYVLLPHARDGVAAASAECLGARLDACLANLAPEQIALALPRFRLETATLDLRPGLESQGMGRAFDPARADFGAMVTQADAAVALGGVLQRVVVDVDEAGAEAAAATVVGMIGIGDEGPAPRPFVVDRPFLFVIRDRTDGTVLFVGRVTDPR